MANGQVSVYRAFNAQGALIYVGLARNWARRWSNHSDRSPFFPEVARLEIQWCPSLTDAADVERALIAEHKPAWNVRSGVTPKKAQDIDEPVVRPRLVSPGDYVAIALREGVSGNWCPVGEVQAVSKRGIRVTLVDWVIGMACGYDELIPWTNIAGMMVATSEHDLTRFGDYAARFQTRCNTLAEQAQQAGD